MVLTVRCQNGSGRKNMYAGPFLFCNIFVLWILDGSPDLEIFDTHLSTHAMGCDGTVFHRNSKCPAAKKSWTQFATAFQFWHFCCRFSWRHAYRNNLCPRSQSDIKWLNLGFAHYLTIYVLEHVGVSAPSKTDV